MKKTDYPSKRTVNLADGSKIGDPRQAVHMFILYLILLGIFVRICVMGPLKAMTDSQISVNQKREELLAYQKSNEDYETIEMEYDQYFCTYLTEQEYDIPNRSPVLMLLKEHVTGNMTLKQIAIKERECQMVVTGGSVSDISKLAEELESSPLIEETEVSLTMEKEAPGATDVTAAITLLLAGGESYAE